MEILSVKNLSFSYNGAEKPAITNAEFSVNSGEICLLMGKSGCGKTTLLKLLKREISPCGEKKGEIYIFNERISTLSNVSSACEIGFVMQNPDEQAVMDNFFSELCFGLENMGISPDEISRRVGETVNFFGIENLCTRQISTLSGGQKQLCNLCAVMVMNPKILILDEPTATLDPVSAENFIRTLLRLNRELGTTIIIAEHNSEEIFPYADKVLLMENGEIISDLNPYETVKEFGKLEKWASFFPCAAQIYSVAEGKKQSPTLTIRAAKTFLEDNFTKDFSENNKVFTDKEVILSAENLSLRYDRDLPDILKDMDIELFKGEFFTIVGSNGVGKTTMIKVLSGLLHFYKGKIKVDGKKIQSYKNGSLYKNMIAVLPQNPYDLFIKETALEDFQYVLKAISNENDDIITKISSQLGISHLLNMHPYDLSGGEAQRCAIARILLCEPKIIMLDEPVKGLDNEGVREVGCLLKDLQKRGITLLCVTHNLEFAAEYSDRCAMYFDGRIIGTDTPEKFFGENNFYTTSASRISRNVFKNCVTISDLKSRILRQGGKNEQE